MRCTNGVVLLLTCAAAGFVTPVIPRGKTEKHEGQAGGKAGRKVLHLVFSIRRRTISDSRRARAPFMIVDAWTPPSEAWCIDQ